MFAGQFPDNLFPGAYQFRKPSTADQARQRLEQCLPLPRLVLHRGHDAHRRGGKGGGQGHGPIDGSAGGREVGRSGSTWLQNLLCQSLRARQIFEPLHHLVVRGTRVALLAVRELEAQELLPQKR